MRVILFQPRFSDLVLTGRKTSTVRVRAHCKPGDELSLRVWSLLPYRSKQKELMRVTCDSVQAVRVYKDRLSIGGMVVSAAEAERFAKRDGFTSFAELAAWFDDVHGLPFQGELITWQHGASSRR